MTSASATYRSPSSSTCCGIAPRLGLDELWKKRQKEYGDLRIENAHYHAIRKEPAQRAWLRWLSSCRRTPGEHRSDPEKDQVGRAESLHNAEHHGRCEKQR